MSDVLSRAEFENLLDEYLRNELPAPKHDAFQQYLVQNPEAKVEVGEARVLLELSVEVGMAVPPEGLVEQAKNDFRECHEKNTEVSERKISVDRFLRPVIVWGIAASVFLAIGLVFWPPGSSLVFAQVIASLSQEESIQVQGWVRGENGVVIPYRQWLLADGTFRAEMGEEGEQRIVVVKGEERLIRDRDGRLFSDLTPFKSREDLGAVLRRLQATYQSPQAVQNSYEFAKEDLGNVIRFTRHEKAMLGGGPSNRKWIMEVDKETALPMASQLHQKIDGIWVQITDLHYSGYNLVPAEDLFHLAGTKLKIDEIGRQKFWFELFISPSSIQTPAVHVPVGGLQVYWPTDNEMPDGMTGGGSTFSRAGVTTHEFLNLPLNTVVTAITRHRVAQNPTSEQHVSLKISAKTVLPWQEKLEPILEKLGLSYELNQREMTRKRWVFKQNGHEIQPSQHRFESYSVTVTQRAHYTYQFERVALHKVVSALMGNSEHGDIYAPGDTVEFYWAGDEDVEENPFKIEVDLEFENPEATLESNMEFLKERFGVDVEVQEETVKVREIVLNDQ